MSLWVDSHCHLTDPRFGESVGLLLRDALGAGVGRVVDCTTHPGEWEEGDRWLGGAGMRGGESLLPPLPSPESDGARREDSVRRDGAQAERLICFGLHPWFVDEAPEGWEVQLEELLGRHPRAGVGEAGLDLRPESPSRERQLAALRVQWEAARRFDRPLVLHSVRADHEWERLFGEWGPVRALFHAYTGSPELTARLAGRGGWFSVGAGLLRLPEEKGRKVWEAIPADRRMVETDAPDFSLTPGVLNRPANLPEIAGCLAELIGTEIGTLRRESAENFSRFWGY